MVATRHLAALVVPDAAATTCRHSTETRVNDGGLSAHENMINGKRCRTVIVYHVTCRPSELLRGAIALSQAGVKGTRRSGDIFASSCHLDRHCQSGGVYKSRSVPLAYEKFTETPWGLQIYTSERNPFPALQIE